MSVWPFECSTCLHGRLFPRTQQLFDHFSPAVKKQSIHYLNKYTSHSSFIFKSAYRNISCVKPVGPQRCDSLVPQVHPDSESCPLAASLWSKRSFLYHRHTQLSHRTECITGLEHLCDHCRWCISSSKRKINKS